jgi:O-antigen/teichoic acid export membrane protein
MLARARELVGQSAIYGLGNLLAQAVRFLLVPLYTQLLTPADYAILSVASTVNAVLSVILQFGLRGAITRFHYDYLDDEKERKAYYGTVWIALTLGSLVGALILDWLGRGLFERVFQNVPFEPYGRLAIWISFFSMASTIPMVLFRVREQAAYYIAFNVAQFAITTISIVIYVAILRQGALGSLRGQLLVSAVFVVPFTVIALRNMRFTFHLRKLVQSLSFGLPMIPHQLSNWALSMSDRLLLTHFVTLEQLGLYDLGYRFGMVLGVILGSINLAWSPFFYRTALSEEDAPTIFARLSTYYAIAMYTLGIGLALVSKEVILLVAKPAFASAYRVVPIVVLAFIANGFYYMVINQLFLVKATKRLPVLTLASAALNIGLNLILVPRFGIVAAAWNTVAGYSLLLLLVYYQSHKLYPVPYEYRRLAVLTVLGTAVFFLGRALRLTNPYLSLLSKFLVTGLFPASLFLLGFFTDREKRGMQLLVRSLGTKITRINLRPR